MSQPGRGPTQDHTRSSSDSSGGRAALIRAARQELDELGHSALSLRAVARRAGLSHAAPKFHFEDRVGLLTAVATQGFEDLAGRLDEVVSTPDNGQLENLGRAYIAFALSNPALFDLMFRASELRGSDPALRTAQERAIGSLRTSLVGADGDQRSTTADDLTLISWAFVHGLAVLTTNRALVASASGEDSPPPDAAERAYRLATVFAQRLDRSTSGPAEQPRPC